MEVFGEVEQAISGIRKLALIRRREDAMAGQAPTLSPSRGRPEGRVSALSSALVLELRMVTHVGGYFVTGPARDSMEARKSVLDSVAPQLRIAP